jgi:transposase-like protein
MAERHTREFWQRLIDEVEGGRSIEIVAKQHGVRPRTLVWWRWRVGQGPRKPKRKARLLPVVVREPAVVFEQPAVVVGVRDVSVRVTVGTDAEYVASLVAALRSSC